MQATSPIPELEGFSELTEVVRTWLTELVTKVDRDEVDIAAAVDEPRGIVRKLQARQDPESIDVEGLGPRKAPRCSR